MANFTITGNVGGATGSGATIELISDRGDINQTYICDASGNFTFTVPDLRTYILIVISTGVATTTCRFSHSVTLAGANVSGVNFQIVNLNSSNNPAPGGF
jgi:hypothetical protein